MRGKRTRRRNRGFSDRKKGRLKAKGCNVQIKIGRRIKREEGQTYLDEHEESIKEKEAIGRSISRQR